ncbi:hypothetical protein Tco_0741481 [Tanacetum coccineum]
MHCSFLYFVFYVMIDHYVAIPSFCHCRGVTPTVEENRQTRPKKYSELTEAQQLQDDCDVQATNIILHGLLLYVYALVNHYEAAKDIWDIVKMLMKDTDLSYEERECRLMIMQQVQVNTKFLNALPSEWIKFVTDVNLAKREDPIECINKAMAFLSAVASRFPPSNNQLRASSNPRNQATIQDGKVTVQQAFQTDNLDAYDSVCDDLSSAKAVLMANLSSWDLEVLSESQENDMVIRKLKDRIKSLSKKDSVKNVKKYIDEIKTINIELEHSVAKLLSENENLRKKQEHLKSIYKDQFDSIRKTRVQSKEHCDSLIAQINAKSVENSDINAQLQEKVFVITALKNELRKLKGENVVNIAVSKPNVTIAPGMFKFDIEPISLRLKNNKDAHEVYIEKTIEYTDTLYRFVKSVRTQSPSEPLLESACMFIKPLSGFVI